MIIKKCPQCGKSVDKYNRSAVERLFGYRVMNGVEHPQSWCRRCRSSK